MSKNVLEGIRVLDLGRIISAPYTAMMMGDMGAEVIKVERAGVGDDMRVLAEFDFPTVNRNKKSVTIQFRSDEGKALLKGLIEKSDVLIENFRPGTMAKMGFSWEEIHKINPRMIVCSISGFGQTGPYSTRGAFDSIIQAVSGMMAVNGNAQTGPMRIGAPLLDHLSAVFGLSAIMMALYEREKTGEGQYIDIGMMDCSVPMLFTRIPIYSATGVIEGSEDTSAPTSVPAHTFQAKDGMIYINGGTQGLFKLLLDVIDDPELHEEKYLSLEYRQQNYQDVYDIVNRWIGDKSVYEVNDLLQAGGVPAGIVSTVDQVINDPHVQARKSIIEFEVPGHGMVKFGANPMKMSAHPDIEYRSAHALGEDNEDVYCNLLGISKEKLVQLTENKDI